MTEEESDSAPTTLEEWLEAIRDGRKHTNHGFDFASKASLELTILSAPDLQRRVKSTEYIPPSVNPVHALYADVDATIGFTFDDGTQWALNSVARRIQ